MNNTGAGNTFTDAVDHRDMFRNLQKFGLLEHTFLYVAQAHTVSNIQGCCLRVGSMCRIVGKKHVKMLPSLPSLHLSVLFLYGFLPSKSCNSNVQLFP